MRVEAHDEARGRARVEELAKVHHDPERALRGREGHDLPDGHQAEARPALPRGRPVQQANDEKLRVEQKQRATRKAAEHGEGYKPKWFTLAPGSNPKKWKFDSTFHYTDEYWQARETGDFGRCQDIFG